MLCYLANATSHKNRREEELVPFMRERESKEDATHQTGNVKE